MQNKKYICLFVFLVLNPHIQRANYIKNAHRWGCSNMPTYIYMYNEHKTIKVHTRIIQKK